MVNASGALRVSIEHKYPMLLFLIDAVFIAGAIFWGWDRQWWGLSGAPALERRSSAFSIQPNTLI